MCDLVHALWVCRIEEDVRSNQQTALMLAAWGGKPEWPSLDERLDEFEAMLVSPPKPVDTEDLELRDALGLRRPGG